MPIKIFISTSEISATQHAAALVSYLQKQYPKRFEFTAIADRELKKLGVSIYEDISTTSSVGFLEAVPHIYSSLVLFRKIKHLFQQEAFDGVFCIDGQGRNIPIGKIAQEVGIHTIYYFPPPIFICMPWDIKSVRKYFDKVFCPFLDNVTLYHKGGVNATHVGHPFVRISADHSTSSRDAIKKKYSIPNHHQVIALFPGSRWQEIKNLTPVYFKTIKQLKKELTRKELPTTKKNQSEIKSTKLSFVLALSHQSFKPKILKYLKQNKLTSQDILIVEDATHDIYKMSDFLWMSSGTATLEASFYGKPHAICYRISLLSYLIIKKLVSYSNLKSIGILNILAKRNICEEFINADCTSKKLLDYTKKILFNAKNYQKIQADLKKQCDIFKKIHPYEAIGKYLLNLKSKR